MSNFQKKLCRCCLTEGFHVDLHAPRTWLGKQEIYSKMMKECFNINIDKCINEKAGICESCITTLRDSYYFRKKVIAHEDKFYKLLEDKDTKEVLIKTEVTDDHEQDSDDYFLAEVAKTDRYSTIDTVKVCKSNENNVKDTTVKSEEQETELLIKTEKKSSPGKKTKAVKIEIKPTNIKLNEKAMQQHNISTILKYSNATAFKGGSGCYTCLYCNINIIDPLELRDHVRELHQDTKFNFKVKEITNFSMSLDVKDLTCVKCGKGMNDLKEFKKHLTDVHEVFLYSDVKDTILQFKLEKNDFKCVFCTSVYETFKMLRHHMNIHYRKYNCEVCDASFMLQKTYRTHKKLHEEGEFKCEYCSNIYKSLAKKKHHIKISHLKIKTLVSCYHCEETFNSYRKRNVHLMTAHNEESKYKCRVCEKALATKSLLNQHIKNYHLMEKNIKCSLCNAQFFFKKHLDQHMLKHTGEKNFVCHYCNKAFGRRYTLREHIRIHENDRRFVCTFCGTAFVNKCSLKGHLLSNHSISLDAKQSCPKETSGTK